MHGTVRTVSLSPLLLSLLLAALATALNAQVDLTGTYDVGTLTPLERPEAFGEQLFLTAEEARNLEAQWESRLAQLNSASDPERSAPPAGGRVGGYNAFWLDRGSAVTSVGGRFRTSILSSPANGRRPAMTAHGAARLEALLSGWRIVWRNPDPTVSRNDGTAWWLALNGPGPYDHIEQRPLAERCILGSRSTAGPPMLPNIYNNHKRIVQTPRAVMILTEMNHDARIIEIVDEPPPSAPGRTPPSWLGSSVGWWDGGTLMVTTSGFRDTPSLSGADDGLTVREQLTPQPDGSITYRFEVDNPTIWTEPWGGEYSWTATSERVYEYACHEGNYTLGNVMRGARLLEREAKSQPSSATE